MAFAKCVQLLGDMVHPNSLVSKPSCSYAWHARPGLSSRLELYISSGCDVDEPARNVVKIRNAKIVVWSMILNSKAWRSETEMSKR
jgi:hypothetical protein